MFPTPLELTTRWAMAVRAESRTGARLIPIKNPDFSGFSLSAIALLKPILFIWLSFIF